MHAKPRAELFLEQVDDVGLENSDDRHHDTGQEGRIDRGLLESLRPEDQIAIGKDFLSRGFLTAVVFVVAVVVDIQAVSRIHKKGYPAEETHKDVENLLLDEHILGLFGHSRSFEPLISKPQ
jgi:hypothetical protein